ncbi:hypothetical protein CMV_017389 [Castanea mollissima]|uniref:Large ribosomal subunit protein bL34m n=1 Tax=Castanea mollissima TaxID=60419 RepID=A0A8J4QR30_9ROSI|nr:hypothetical protein CMV_017389 [Castanea mollissima]
MASKTLVRTGASLVSRFLSNPFLRQSPNPNPNQRIVSQGLDIAPKLFPSLSKFENSLHLPQYQNDAESIRKVASEGFVYPSGLPSLSFYLPEGDVSSSNEPMILFPKRTFQPSTIRRKRNHGFFARKATKGGRKVIARRIAKGRFRITA